MVPLSVFCSAALSCALSTDQLCVQNDRVHIFMEHEGKVFSILVFVQGLLLNSRGGICHFGILLVLTLILFHLYFYSWLSRLQPQTSPKLCYKVMIFFPNPLIYSSSSSLSLIHHLSLSILHYQVKFSRFNDNSILCEFMPW